MTTLHWSSRFTRSFAKKTKQREDVRKKIVDIMRLLEENPFQPILKTHKLRGIFDGSFACSVEYDLRIVFDFVKNPVTSEDEILLIDIGSHEEVY
jgi:addiction module RelE/StbE family toxin